MVTWLAFREAHIFYLQDTDSKTDFTSLSPAMIARLPHLPRIEVTAVLSAILKIADFERKPAHQRSGEATHWQHSSLLWQELLPLHNPALCLWFASSRCMSALTDNTNRLQSKRRKIIRTPDSALTVSYVRRHVM